MDAQPADQACKYRVHRMSDGWRIERGRDCVGMFANAADAIEAACRQARTDADHGHIAMVTTDTVPQEFHCYVPAPTGHAAAPKSAHLRLVTRAE